MVSRSALAALASACMVAHTTAGGPPCFIYSTNIESPCFYELSNSSSYQLRIYGHDNPEFWSNAEVNATSFNDATQAGFQLNFNYISGANVPRVKIPMTAPVITRGGLGAAPTTWNISFYVPASLYPSYAAIPQPTEKGMSIVGGINGGMTFAVSEFGGYATWNDFQVAEGLLRNALAADGINVLESTPFSVIYAQYDSPFVIFNRHNEVWLQVQL